MAKPRETESMTIWLGKDFKKEVKGNASRLKLNDSNYVRQAIVVFEEKKNEMSPEQLVQKVEAAIGKALRSIGAPDIMSFQNSKGEVDA